MTTYFSTFITGFSEPVEEQLRDDLPDIRIDLLLDGLVVYSSPEEPQRIKGLRYLNNSFILLRQLNIKSHDLPEDVLKTLSTNIDFKNAILPLSLPKGTTFRLIVSKENQMTGVKKATTKYIENKILAKTHLQLNPLKADVEFWFLIRSEGKAFFGIRLTGLTETKGKPEKGELRAELAHLLCLLSKPDASDTFLDPFCGSGAIPLERSLSFPYKQIVASDSDLSLVEALKHKELPQKVFRVSQMDALTLDGIEDQSIDKIVTDPPWGFYNADGKQEMDLDEFYEDMLKAFTRVIKPNGTIIILTARKEILEEALMKQRSLHTSKRYDILVSGKKAGAYVLNA